MDKKLLLVLGIILAGVIFTCYLIPTRIGTRDFNAYWAASRLFIEGRNPCNPVNMSEVERTHFHSNARLLMVWNPPTMWVFILPFALMPFWAARTAWLLTNIVLILVSCALLGTIYLPRGNSVSLLIYCLVAVFFPPVFVTVLMGQVALLVVFGIAACIFFIEREQWFLAGMFLVLTSVKPHLVVLLAPYFLFHMGSHGRWTGWVGFVVTGVACMVILFVLRPSWILDFSAILRNPPVNRANSTIGGFLARRGIAGWPRYAIFGTLPLVLVIAHRLRGCIKTTSAVLVLVTLPVTFYGWSFDQSLLLIPMAQVVGWLLGSRVSWLTRLSLWVFIIALVGVNIVQRVVGIDETLYLWVPLAWAVIYGVTYHQHKTRLPSH